MSRWTGITTGNNGAHRLNHWAFFVSLYCPSKFARALMKRTFLVSAPSRSGKEVSMTCDETNHKEVWAEDTETIDLESKVDLELLKWKVCGSFHLAS